LRRQNRFLPATPTCRPGAPDGKPLSPTHARASEPRPEPRARGRTWDEIPRSPMKEPELVYRGYGYPGDLLVPNTETDYASKRYAFEV